VGLLFSGSFQSDEAAGHGRWGISSEELANTWKRHLAAIISNRSAATGSDQMIASLGDRLREDGDIMAAHFCFLVGGIPLSGAASPNTKIALLGCDHTIQSTLALQTKDALSAFERTEALEWARQQGNKKARFASFMPFKLIYAMILIGSRERDQALPFLESISVAVPDAPSDIKSVFLRDVFGSTASLAMALEQATQDLSADDAEHFLRGGELKISVVPSITGPSVSLLNPQYDAACKPPVSSSKAFIPATPVDDQRNFFMHAQPTPHSKPDPDATFATAKTNLMDVTGYSLDDVGGQVDNQQYPSHDEPQPSMYSLQGPTLATPVADCASKHEDQDDINRTASAGPPFVSAIASDQASEHQRKQIPKPPVTAPPVMIGQDAGKKEVPKTPAPSSSGARTTSGGTPLSGIKSWFIKKFNPDATECTLPENEEKAYYDEDRKRWIFPGDDPDEVAAPLAPPPIVPKAALEATPEPANNAPLDPLAAMMAPPSSRIPSKKSPAVSGGPPGVPFAGRLPPGMMQPVGSRPGLVTPAQGGGMKTMPTPPQFAVFTPKSSTSDKDGKQ
jgi:hypothetical protein